jgi:hypothetical protein
MALDIFLDLMQKALLIEIEYAFSLQGGSRKLENFCRI